MTDGTAPGLDQLLREACGMLKILDRKQPHEAVSDFLARADAALVTLRQGVEGQQLKSSEDGRLFDLLDEAARLIDDGRVAESEAMKCVYREAILESLNRLRKPAASAPPPETGWRILELAREAARDAHCGAATISSLDDGRHEFADDYADTNYGFSTCSHPDCKLVREVSKADPPGRVPPQAEGAQ